MKRLCTFIAFLGLFFSSSFAADCPSFGGVPAGGYDVFYNLNATSWSFIVQVYGDTTGAEVQWYTYTYGHAADTVPFYGQGYNTVSDCHPSTSSSELLYYVCFIKTQNCPEGVLSSPFAVHVYTDCGTMGSSFTLSGKSSATEGDKLVLKAHYNGYGGFHYYTWYKDGIALDSTAEHGIWNDPDNFGESVLTLPACALTDAGKYTVRIEDGTSASGSPCSMTTNALTLTVNPKPECEQIVYRKWDDMLFVDNGLGEYTSYQWYRDNAPVQGATRQYLYTEGVTLSGDGHRYHVIATTKSGQQVKSCVEAFDGFPKSIDGRQTSIRRAVLYSHMGTPVGEWNSKPESVSVAPGMYIWYLTDDEGYTWTQKVVY